MDFCIDITKEKNAKKFKVGMNGRNEDQNRKCVVLIEYSRLAGQHEENKMLSKIQLISYLSGVKHSETELENILKQIVILNDSHIQIKGYQSYLNDFQQMQKIQIKEKKNKKQNEKKKENQQEIEKENEKKNQKNSEQEEEEVKEKALVKTLEELIPHIFVYKIRKKKSRLLEFLHECLLKKTSQIKDLYSVFTKNEYLLSLIGQLSDAITSIQNNPGTSFIILQEVSFNQFDPFFNPLSVFLEYYYNKLFEEQPIPNLKKLIKITYLDIDGRDNDANKEFFDHYPTLQYFSLPETLEEDDDLGVEFVFRKILKGIKAFKPVIIIVSYIINRKQVLNLQLLKEFFFKASSLCNNNLIFFPRIIREPFYVKELQSWYMIDDNKISFKLKSIKNELLLKQEAYYQESQRMISYWEQFYIKYNFQHFKQEAIFKQFYQDVNSVFLIATTQDRIPSTKQLKQEIFINARAAQISSKRQLIAKLNREQNIETVSSGFKLMEHLHAQGLVQRQKRKQLFAKKYKQLEHFSYCEDEDFEYYVYGFIGEEWHDEVIKVGKKDGSILELKRVGLREQNIMGRIGMTAIVVNDPDRQHEIHLIGGKYRPGYDSHDSKHHTVCKMIEVIIGQENTYSSYVAQQSVLPVQANILFPLVIPQENNLLFFGGISSPFQLNFDSHGVQQQGLGKSSYIIEQETTDFYCDARILKEPIRHSSTEFSSFENDQLILKRNFHSFDPYEVQDAFKEFKQQIHYRMEKLEKNIEFRLTKVQTEMVPLKSSVQVLFKNKYRLFALQKDTNTYLLINYDYDNARINQRVVILTNSLDSSYFHSSTLTFFGCYTLIDDNKIVIVSYKSQIQLDQLTSPRCIISLRNYKQFEIKNHINPQTHIKALIYPIVESNSEALYFLFSNGLFLASDETNRFISFNLNNKSKNLKISHQIQYFFQRKLNIKDNHIIFYSLFYQDLTYYQLTIDKNEAQLQQDKYSFQQEYGQEIIHSKVTQGQIKLYIFDQCELNVLLLKCKVILRGQLQVQEMQQLKFNEFLIKKLNIMGKDKIDKAYL